MTIELKGVLTECWQMINDGSKTAGHAFRNITVAHYGGSYVNAYTVVLRAASEPNSQLLFYTDIRSPKVEQIKAHKHLTVCGYDTETKVQLLLKGEANIHYQDDLALHYWQTEGRKSRKSYLAQPAPSTIIDEAQDGLAYLQGVNFEDADPNGYENFCVVKVAIKELECLKLSHDGNRRAQFTLQQDGTWQGCWLIP